jgi:hypothetical protein
MIEITYTHIYMLTPTLGVMQNMPSIHKKINTPEFKEISLLVILLKERRVIEKKEYMLKKHRRKMVLQSKSIKKRESKHNPPPKEKARGESQSKECLEKETNIFHTLAHLDQVA